MTSANVVLTLVYLAYLLSPAIRDEFFLRLALMCTSMGFIIWGFMIDDGWVAIVANALFVIIGSRHLRRLYLQRQPVELTSDQEQVHEAVFGTMSPREFLLFWHLGRTDDHESGTTLITKGEALDDVLVVTSGGVVIEIGSGDIHRVAPMLLGEMSYALGIDAVATATVRCDGPVEVRRWTKATLRDLQRSHPDLAVPFLRSIGANLAAKIG